MKGMPETHATYGTGHAATVGLPVEIIAALEAQLQAAYERGYADGQAIDAWAEIEVAVAGSAPRIVPAADEVPATGDWDFEPGHDKVTSDGVTFHRARTGVTADFPTLVRIEARRPLTDGEIDHLGHLVSYAYQASVRGDAVSHPERDSDYSFVVSADTSTSHRTDPMAALAQFEANLPHYIANGTPVRRTDRAGAGTKGTRAVDPLADPDLAVSIFYDRVTENRDR